MEPKSALEEAIKKAGGQTALAKKVGGKCRQGHVYAWLKAGRVSHNYVLDVERETEVSRSLLRPDLYPELRAQKTA